MAKGHETQSFDSPLSGDGTTRASKPAFPETIGAYRLLECLGEGGMGTVYKANQQWPVKRTVAIKLIKLGFDSAEVIARFESERQALARMDHPNIARVLDAGTDERGRPYFVMEYVPGKPITKYADDNRLSIEQRLELMLQVCDAIGHAHAKSIIHRDIKSGNVLAHTTPDGPRIKVIDFGVAKALTSDRLTDRTFNTARGQAIGTYESMSPEQADGSPDIDTRTDVYSLGVLLYELLSGSKPFDKSNLAGAADAEIRRIIREEEPPRPSTQLSSMGGHATNIAKARQIDVEALTRQLKSELDWIPLMALRKERERRYATPQQMAQDIRNYLDGRPLIAAPDSRMYRVSKFARRNRGLIIAGTSVVSALIVATMVSTMALLVAIRAKAAAEHQRRVAEEQRHLEEVARTTAEEERALAVNARQTADDATNAFTSIIIPARSDQNMTILQAVREAEKHLDEKFQSPEVRNRVRVALGTALNELGKYDEAIEVLRRVSEFGDDAHGDLVTAELYEQLSVALGNSGRFGREDEIFDLLNRALAIRKRLQPADSDQITELKADIAGITMLEDNVPKGEEAFLLTMQPFFGNLPLPKLRARIYAELEQAKFQVAHGRADIAVEQFRELVKPLLDSPASRRQVPDGLRVLSVFVMRAGDVLGGETLARISAKLSEEVNGPEDPLHARDVFQLGTFLVDKEHDTKGEEGTAFMRTALDIARRKLGPTNPTTIEYAAHLAAALRSLGKTVDAEQVRAELLAGVPADDMEGARVRARMLSLLAFDVATCVPVGPADLDEAETDARQAVESAEKGFANEDSDNDFFYISLDLETVLRTRQKFTEARQVGEKWIGLMTAKYGAVDRHVGEAQNRVGLNLMGLGRTSEAVQAFKQAASTLDSSGARSELLIESLLNLGNAQDAVGDTPGAEASYRLYLDRSRLRYGDDNPQTLEAMRVLAQKLAHRADARPEAGEMFSQALKQSRRLLGANGELTLKIQKSAQDCGMMPTTGPVGSRASSIR